MKILLAIDDSQCSDAAIRATAFYVSPTTHVLVLHVVEWPVLLPSSFGFAQGALAAEAVLGVRDRMVAKGESLVSRVADTLKHAGLDTSTRVVVGNAAETILECAEGWGAQLIVVGTHGRRGIDRLVLGSVAEAVVRQAGCPVETVCTPAA